MEDIVVEVLDVNDIPEYATKEEERQNNEIARQEAEKERVNNELERALNEDNRQSSETERDNFYNEIRQQVNDGAFDGKDGKDGFSPIVETSKSGKVTTISITDVNGEHVATISDGEDGSAGGGDMMKSVYDTNGNGVVDNAEKVNNHTVEMDVPSNAKFTDTVFSGDYNDLSNKPSIPNKLSDLSDDATHRVVTDTEKDLWNNKSNFSGDYNDLNNKPDISNKQDTIQFSTMPIASADNLGKIVQFVGTTTDDYINGYFYKCVSDGLEPATYSWEEAEVQTSSGGSSYSAGNNIEITNENVINNTIPFSTSNNGRIKLGSSITDNSGYADILAIGNSCKIGAYVKAAIAIGNLSEAGESQSIAIGIGAKCTKNNQAVIGGQYALINELAIYTNKGEKIIATQEFVTKYLTTLANYDETKTQVLKNVNGTLTWSDEE